MSQAMLLERDPTTYRLTRHGNGLPAAGEIFEHQVVMAAADRIPELKAVRDVARLAAEAKLEANMELLRQGEFDAVPIPVDALGTAREVVAAGKLWGKESEAYKYRLAGLRTDTQRLLAEARRKNTWELFPEIAHDRNPEDGAFYFHGQPLRQLTDNALTPMAEPEEQERRVNERVEEATYEAVYEQPNANRLSVLTVSECTDWAKASYRRNPKGGHGGYVPPIDKFMVRRVRFDTVTGQRFESQLGLPGLLIDHEVINQGMELLGGKDRHEPELGRTEVHRRQLVVDNEVIDDHVITVARLLDNLASAKHGIPVFMGEPLPKGKTADYAAAIRQAEARQNGEDPAVDELTDHILALAEDDTDAWAGEALVEAKAKQLLFEEVKNSPEKAAEVFDEQTAQGIQQAADLRAQGQHDRARQLIDNVQQAAPSPGYCGAGSCELEGVKADSVAGQKAQKLGLEAGAGKELLHDLKRPCPSCNNLTVMYDTNGSKACTSCDKKEIKGKK